MKSGIPNHIELSGNALKMLEEVLKKDIGEEAFNEFTENNLYDFGVFILTLTSLAIQVNMRK